MRMNAETLRRAKALLENETPLKTDCGALCGAACCRTDADGKGGVYLFPGEDAAEIEVPAGDAVLRHGDGRIAVMARHQFNCRYRFVGAAGPVAP